MNMFRIGDKVKYNKVSIGLISNIREITLDLGVKVACYTVLLNNDEYIDTLEYKLELFNEYIPNRPYPFGNE